MGDGVADERDAAQDDVRAHDRADQPDHRRRDERPDEEAEVSGSVISSISRRAVVFVEVPLAGRGVVVVVGVVEDHGPALEDQQMTAVRAGEDVGVEHDVGRPVGHDRAIDRQHLLEPLGRAGEVVGGRDDRLAPLRLGLEEVHQVLLRRRVDAGDRLVEQEQVGLRGQRAGEEHAPSLAARQAADLRPQVATMPTCVEGVARPLADRRDPAGARARAAG